MRLNDLHPSPGSRHRPTRVGRGPGSGKGKTSGRGHKGQKARRQVRPAFEGGQMPMQRRLPKRGFRPRGRVENELVKIEDLKIFPAGGVVDLDALEAQGLVRPGRPVKLLADGEIAVPLTVRLPALSERAQQKIEAAGGKVERL